MRPSLDLKTNHTVLRVCFSPRAGDPRLVRGGRLDVLAAKMAVNRRVDALAEALVDGGPGVADLAGRSGEGVHTYFKGRRRTSKRPATLLKTP